MNSTQPLTEANLRTYHLIFRDPGPSNLEWQDVHALFRQLGSLVVEPDGNLEATCDGEVLILPAPSSFLVSDPSDVLALRRFLERSTGPLAPAHKPTADWLVIIDHREARIYRSAAPDAVPQQIRPHVSDNCFLQAPRALGSVPAPGNSTLDGFFEPVAAVLNGAGKVLVFGSGPGLGREMEQFTLWLKEHRPELAKRLVGSVVVGESHFSEGHLLAKARAFFAHLPPG